MERDLATVDMNDNLLTDVMTFVNAAFPADGLKVALVLALLSALAVISVFAYLNLQTPKPYFRFWAGAWLSYSLYLTTSMGWGKWSDSAVVVALRCASIGAG